MRQVLIIVGVAALAACGGSGGGENSTSDAPTAASPAAKDDQAAVPEVKLSKEIVLGTNGVNVGGKPFAFGADRATVEAALNSLLGKSDNMDAEECGDGPMVLSSYEGGFGANYFEGKLVGWFWRDPMDDESPPTAKISTDSFMTLGTMRAQVEKVPGYEFYADSTLGEEFYIENKPSGMFHQGRVTTLFSGMQCFFR